jgi:small subunit ribosomal protein S21
MPSVRVKENESFEMAVRRFKRSCEKTGLISEMHRHEFYEKPKDRRKREKAAAVKRQQKNSAKHIEAPARGVKGGKSSTKLTKGRMGRMASRKPSDSDRNDRA